METVQEHATAEQRPEKFIVNRTREMLSLMGTVKVASPVFPLVVMNRNVSHIAGTWAHMAIVPKPVDKAPKPEKSIASLVQDKESPIVFVVHEYIQPKPAVKMQLAQPTTGIPAALEIVPRCAEMG